MFNSDLERQTDRRDSLVTGTLDRIESRVSISDFLLSSATSPISVHICMPGQGKVGETGQLWANERPIIRTDDETSNITCP